jgi:hypothetical protein
MGTGRRNRPAPRRRPGTRCEPHLRSSHIAFLQTRGYCLFLSKEMLYSAAASGWPRTWSKRTYACSSSSRTDSPALLASAPIVGLLALEQLLHHQPGHVSTSVETIGLGVDAMIEQSLELLPDDHGRRDSPRILVLHVGSRTHRKWKPRLTRLTGRLARHSSRPISLPDAKPDASR